MISFEQNNTSNKKRIEQNVLRWKHTAKQSDRLYSNVLTPAKSRDDWWTAELLVFLTILALVKVIH